jgi:MFS family permease
MDIGGSHAGVVSAAMNTTGQIGSIVSPVVAGWTVQRFSDWQAPLLIMGSLYLLSGVLWAFVDPRKRLADRPAR